MGFELRQLHFVLAAAEHRSFRGAAEAMDMEQSSLSRAIKQMETQIGTALFERSPAGVRPTYVGRLVLGIAERMVRDSDLLLRTARRAAAGETGRLTIGFYTSLAAGQLRATLIEFQRRWPEIFVDLIEAPRERLFAKLSAGVIDVALVTGNERFEYTLPLWGERLYVAVPINHPLDAKERVFWTDLGPSRVLVPRTDPGPDVVELLESRLVHAVERPEVLLMDVGWEAIRSLAAAGFGIAIVHEACLGCRHDGLAYQLLHDGNSVCRLNYAAHWCPGNGNPALKQFQALLIERHPPPDRQPGFSAPLR